MRPRISKEKQEAIYQLSKIGIHNKEIASLLDLRYHQVIGERRNQGIKKYHGRQEMLEKEIRFLTSQGLPDRAIASHLGLTRGQILWRRRQLKIPKGNTKSFYLQEYAIDHGWPEYFRARETQILDALFIMGPRNKEQLVLDLQLPCPNLRKKFSHSDKKGSYLARLLEEGFIFVLKKSKDKRGQNSRPVYALTPYAIKRKVDHLESSINSTNKN